MRGPRLDAFATSPFRCYLVDLVGEPRAHDPEELDQRYRPDVCGSRTMTPSDDRSVQRPLETR